MILKAMPYLLAYLLVPLVVLGMVYGGTWIAIAIVITLLGAPLVDALTSLNTDSLDADTEDKDLFWHRLITWLWVPTQLCVIIALLYIVGQPGWLSTYEAFWAAASVGLLSGGIGITYAHELMHQKSKFERTLAEITVCSTLYGHFCIEHIFGHHINVATPDDPATARRNQNIYIFIPRSLILGFISAWKIQAKQLAKRGQSLFSFKNAFWKYGAWTLVWFAAAYLLAGWLGVAMFLVQAFVAVSLLETVNYLEHYGLERRKLPNGKYEPVQPHHSWNANHRATNFMLINLQRHSDHHFKPSRRYPLLQAYSEDEAPQLPLGYPIMLFAAYVPPLWFAIMNPRLEDWHLKYYGTPPTTEPSHA